MTEDRCQCPGDGRGCHRPVFQSKFGTRSKQAKYCCGCQMAKCSLAIFRADVGARDCPARLHGPARIQTETR